MGPSFGAGAFRRREPTVVAPELSDAHRPRYRAARAVAGAPELMSRGAPERRGQVGQVPKTFPLKAF